MFTGRIGIATKHILQEDNSEFLSVPLDILDENGETVHVQNLGFPLDMPAEDIKAEISAVVAAYNTNNDIKERNKAHDEMHAVADETINALRGTEI